MCRAQQGRKSRPRQKLATVDDVPTCLYNLSDIFSHLVAAPLSWPARAAVGTDFDDQQSAFMKPLQFLKLRLDNKKFACLSSDFH